MASVMILSGVLFSQGRKRMHRKVDMKVVMLGQESCGKTSLVERFIYKRFNCFYQATIGNRTIYVYIIFIYNVYASILHTFLLYFLLLTVCIFIFRVSSSPMLMLCFSILH